MSTEIKFIVFLLEAAAFFLFFVISPLSYIFFSKRRVKLTWKNRKTLAAMSVGLLLMFAGFYLAFSHTGGNPCCGSR